MFADSWGRRSAIVFVLLALGVSVPLRAQGVVQQVGPVTAGHLATWWQNGQVSDGGPVPAPSIREVLPSTTGGATSLQGGDYTAFRASALQTNAYMSGGPAAGGGVFVYNASCTPNSITCVRDTGGNNWQLAQGYPVSVLQAGAYGDATHDDTTAIQAAVNLFTSRGAGTATGILNFCGLFNISKPIVYAGAPAQSVVFQGCQSAARGVTKGAALIWKGTGYPAMFISEGANETVWDGINFDAGTAGSGLITDLWLSADNTTSTTLSGAVTAGASVTFAVNAASNITTGRLLGIGIGTANFEVVYVTAVSGTNVTARILNNHASGEAVGQSSGSSGASVRNASMVVPAGVHSTLNGAVTAGSAVTVTPISMTGIVVGYPLFLGSLTPSVANEIVYPISVGGSSFTANVVNNHTSGEDVMTAGSAVLVGNVTAGSTDQISETIFSNNVLIGYLPSSGQTYGCMRFIEAGNVKNHRIEATATSGCRYGYAFEGSSGAVSIIDARGASLYADVLTMGTAVFNIRGLETEDVGARMIEANGTPGANSAALVITSSTWQGSAPADDYIIHKYGGNITLIGNQFFNTRTGSSIPKIAGVGLYGTSGIRPSAITSIGNYYQHAGNLSGVFYDCCDDPINYSGYPIGSGLIPTITSVGDYGSNGNFQYMSGSLSLMGAGPTIDGLSSGISFPSVARAGGTYTPITVPFAALQTAATTKNLSILGLPPKTKIVSAYVDVTTPFTGTAGTLQLKLGTTSGASDLLVAFDAKSGAVTSGLASGDLGTCLATIVQNGCLPSWASTSTLYLGAVSGSGNLSTLAAGSATIWIETEALR